MSSRTVSAVGVGGVCVAVGGEAVSAVVFCCERGVSRESISQGAAAERVCVCVCC